MLDKFRAHVKGWLGMLVIIMISIPFALWGLQNYTNGESETPLAQVADKKIYQADVNNAYQQRVDQLKNQYGEEYSADLFNEQALKNEALSSLIREALIRYNIDNQGYAVSEQSVLDVIANLEAFQKNGSFDKATYQRLLRAKGISSVVFVEQVKQGIEREQFIKGIVDTSLVTQAEIDSFYRLNNQKRDIKFLSLPLDKMLSEVDVSDEELKENFQLNQSLYIKPAQVSIDYVELTLADLMSAVKPTNDELRKFYETEKSSFSVPGRRRVSHILIDLASDASEQEINKKREIAESVLVRINKGESFSSLAKELSDDLGSAKNGGDLGLINTGVLDTAVEEVLSTLKQGETSPIIQTSYGFQVIKLTELEADSIPSYEKMMPKLDALYKEQLASNDFELLSEKLANLSFENPESLDVLTSELGLEIKHEGFFSQQNASGIAKNNKVMSVAFSEDFLAGNNSEVIEISDTRLVVMHLNEHRVSTIKEFDEVKSLIKLSIQRVKAAESLKLKADELFKQLTSGADFETVADENQLSITDVGPITRNEKGYPQELLGGVFKMTAPSESAISWQQVNLRDGGIAIVALYKMIDADTSDMTTEESDAIRNFLVRLKGEVMFAATLANLAEEAEVAFATKNK